MDELDQSRVKKVPYSSDGLVHVFEKAVKSV